MAQMPMIALASFIVITHTAYAIGAVIQALLVSMRTELHRFSEQAYIAYRPYVFYMQ